MTLFSKYEEKIIRLTDDQGNTFTGVAETFPAEYGMHEFGVEEEGIELGDYVIYKSQIAKIDILPTYEEVVKIVKPGQCSRNDGLEYEIITIARHSETGETMVIYKALQGGNIMCMPADRWISDSDSEPDD